MPGHWVYENTWGLAVPVSTLGAGSSLIYGNYFQVATNGLIVGIRYYRNSTDPGEHVGAINAEANNELLSIVKFPYVASGGPAGWQHAYIRPHLKVYTGTFYNVMVEFSDRRVRYTAGALNGVDITVGNITFPRDSASHWNGFHAENFGRIAYTHEPGVRFGVDILFLAREV